MSLRGAVSIAIFHVVKVKTIWKNYVIMGDIFKIAIYYNILLYFLKWSP